MYTLLLILTINSNPAMENVKTYQTLEQCKNAGEELRKSFAGTRFIATFRCV